MKYITFEERDKIALFDRIAEKYYEQNFGQMSKADMEMLMFQFYIEKMVEKNRAEDGTIDYNKCSDYIISKELGITQQRVRNLKVKNQLVHPIEFDWKLALAKLTENARFDSVSHKVTLNIPDPCLYLEIQNFIEEKGGYIEKQLNTKILNIRAEYYIDLIIALEPENKRNEIIKKMRSFFAKQNKEQNQLDERHIGKSLLNAAVEITTVAANISSLISPENYVGNALINLLTKN